jgi:hypothetical protein
MPRGPKGCRGDIGKRRRSLPHLRLGEIAAPCVLDGPMGQAFAPISSS